MRDAIFRRSEDKKKRPMNLKVPSQCSLVLLIEVRLREDSVPGSQVP
jgi:hypothetical protein